MICELILVLVSLWLLVNSFKETSKKRPIDFFIILFKDILIILLLFYKIFWLFYYYFAFFGLTEIAAWMID